MDKILVIGDPHIRICNFDKFDLFTESLMGIIETDKPELIICLGDILHNHERLHTSELNKAVEFINLLSNKSMVYLLVGNHDYINNQQYLTDKHWMKCLYSNSKVKIIDKVCKIEHNKLNIIGVPYVPNGRFIEALGTYDLDYKDCDLIFAHQELSGVKMGCIVSECEDWDDDNPLIISGHIHSYQYVQDNLFYPGSILQNAFGESKHNIVLLISEDNVNKFSMEEIDFQLPRKKILYYNIEDINDNFNKIYKKIKEENEDDNEIKLVIKDNRIKSRLFLKDNNYKKLCKLCKVVVKIDELQCSNELETEKKDIETSKDILNKIIKDINKVSCMKIRNEILDLFKNIIN